MRIEGCNTCRYCGRILNGGLDICECSGSQNAAKELTQLLDSGVNEYVNVKSRSLILDTDDKKEKRDKHYDSCVNQLKMSGHLPESPEEELKRLERRIKELKKHMNVPVCQICGSRPMLQSSGDDFQYICSNRGCLSSGSLASTKEQALRYWCIMMDNAKPWDTSIFYDVDGKRYVQFTVRFQAEEEGNYRMDHCSCSAHINTGKMLKSDGVVVGKDNIEVQDED